MPHHDLSLLDGCSTEDLIAIGERIGAAIESGAPVYNQGSFAGCFHIYAAVVYEVDEDFPGCTGPRHALHAGLTRVQSLASFDDKAWAMRDAFDGLLDVLGRALEAALPAATLPPAQGRNVPSHPISVLDDCSAEDRRTLATTIVGAIQAGAPLYNEHNFEACYRIYAGAALELAHTLTSCVALVAALEVGLENAKTTASYSDKAWHMRDAFDGVLDVLERAELN